MAKKLKDLQKLIEEKAYKRLCDDFDSVTKPICGSRLFTGDELNKLFGIKKGEEAAEFTSAYWAFMTDDNKSSYFSEIKRVWLPIYIDEESKRFLEDVERLKADVDNLMQGSYNQDY